MTEPEYTGRYPASAARATAAASRSSPRETVLDPCSYPAHPGPPEPTRASASPLLTFGNSGTAPDLCAVFGLPSGRDSPSPEFPKVSVSVPVLQATHRNPLLMLVPPAIRSSTRALVPESCRNRADARPGGGPSAGVINVRVGSGAPAPVERGRIVLPLEASTCAG
jgi:hypothetical protein